MQYGSNYPLLMNELKKVFKRKKLKYTDVSEHLGMSESSIKRLMSGHDTSLSKLESLCEVAGITFFDLVELCKNQVTENYFLTEKQDHFFARNTHYFYFFHLLYEENQSVKQIKKTYKLTDKSVSNYLKKLEQLQMLERHPGDKIKFLITGSIQLKQSSRLGSFLLKNSMNNLASMTSDMSTLKNKLKGKEGTFHIGEYFLRPETAKIFSQRLAQLHEEIDSVSDREKRIFGKSELDFFTAVTTMLPARLYYEDIPNL